MGLDLVALKASKKYVDDTLIGAGALKGEKGDPGSDGYSPVITENSANTDEVYKLDITDKNGSFTTPNLKGMDGVSYTDAEIQEAVATVLGGTE